MGKATTNRLAAVDPTEEEGLPLRPGEDLDSVAAREFVQHFHRDQFCTGRQWHPQGRTALYP